MAFDYKKEYKEFYLPKSQPQLITIPPLDFIAVRGQGDPNAEGGEYQRALGLLYGVAFTLKMSYKTDRHIDGYFDYVVPPLEGLWWMDDMDGVDYAHKEGFHWISLIRLPEFISRADLDWAKDEAARKKKTDFSPVEWFHYDEGLCVQCLHVGSFDSEPATVELMHRFAREQGRVSDFSAQRLHHEIYLNDARKCAADKLRTVIRHPLR